MNLYRILTTAAAGSALLAAVAPSAQAAQALDLGGTLSGTARTAATVGERAKPVAEQLLGDKVQKKVGAVKGVVQAGSDAVKAGNDLVQ
ncbi:hypothetical protein GCM10009654_00290 [Streptomyces hebeiensis]|uniref:ATP-binding protein n=1 Tax=Streptomyces hebeiensis TaxID=229486 RepID=A0ABN1UHV6_9ACTN|nr:hypothetical protein [Streptomyces sp. NRRL F-5135]